MKNKIITIILSLILVVLTILVLAKYNIITSGGSQSQEQNATQGYIHVHTDACKH